MSPGSTPTRVLDRVPRYNAGAKKGWNPRTRSAITLLRKPDAGALYLTAAGLSHALGKEHPRPSRSSKVLPLMSSTSTLEQVRLIMEDVFDIDDLAVTPETTAADLEEWDSLSHIRLIVAIERKFKIKFKNSELEGLMNVGDLLKVIAGKLG